jgi:hypothetical protein
MPTKTSRPPLLIALAVLAGCANAPGDEPTDDDLEDTIVTIKADGTTEVRTEKTTRARVEQEIAARDRLAAGQAAPELAPGQPVYTLINDSGCAGASMWMFDQPNLLGRRICFYRQGLPADWVDFTAIVRGVLGGKYPGFWGGAVRSAFAGGDAGYFRNMNSPIGVLRFARYQRFDAASPELAGARLLFLAEAGREQDAVFSYTVRDWSHSYCDWMNLRPQFNMDSGDEYKYDTHVDVLQVGSDGGSGVLCRLSYHVGNMLPGKRYDISLTGNSQTASCTLWPAENGYLSTFGTVSAAPINLSSCTTETF